MKSLLSADERRALAQRCKALHWIARAHLAWVETDATRRHRKHGARLHELHLSLDEIDEEPLVADRAAGYMLIAARALDVWNELADRAERSANASKDRKHKRKDRVLHKKKDRVLKLLKKNSAMGRAAIAKKAKCTVQYVGQIIRERTEK